MIVCLPENYFENARTIAVLCCPYHLIKFMVEALATSCQRRAGNGRMRLQLGFLAAASFNLGGAD